MSIRIACLCQLPTDSQVKRKEYARPNNAHPQDANSVGVAESWSQEWDIANVDQKHDCTKDTQDAAKPECQKAIRTAQVVGRVCQDDRQNQNGEKTPKENRSGQEQVSFSQPLNQYRAQASSNRRQDGGERDNNKQSQQGKLKTDALRTSWRRWRFGNEHRIGHAVHPCNETDQRYRVPTRGSAGCDR